jgi:phosphomannomutase/phosphoglucomutase
MDKFIGESTFEDAVINTIDGIRVNFADGWGLVRPSNTTPCLVLRFEANDEKTLNKIQNIFREKILAINNTLDLPF